MRYEHTAPVVSVHALCIAAVMTALICIMTVVPRIPIPLGYAHLGDAVIFLLALYGQHKESAVAASVGSAFADLIGGFPIWIIPTVIIKYIMVVIVWKIVGSAPGSSRILSRRVLLGFCLSAFWMVFGYTLGGAVLYGSLVIGMTAAPGLVMEGVVNVIAAVGAGILLERVQFHID